jgi:hypothetical protein
MREYWLKHIDEVIYLRMGDYTIWRALEANQVMFLARFIAKHSNVL